MIYIYKCPIINGILIPIKNDKVFVSLSNSMMKNFSHYQTPCTCQNSVPLNHCGPSPAAVLPLRVPESWYVELIIHLTYSHNIYLYSGVDD